MSALISVGAFLLAAAATPVVGSTMSVRGDTACPTREQVSAALEGLVPPPSPPAPSDVVELRGHDNGVSVRLASGAGEFIAEKALPTTGGCDERARAAAVIVAAWEARLRAGLAGALVVPPVETPAPVEAAPPPPPPPVVVPPAPAAVEVERDLPPPRAPLEVSPGAAALASVVAGELAAGALAEVAFSRRDARYGLAVGGLVVDTHATAVGPGQGAWRRVGGVVDGRARLRAGRVELVLRAGLALTAISVGGRSFSRTSGSTLFDPGVLAALRLRVRVGSVTPWLEGAATFWPAGHTLILDGSSATADLPSTEALLSLGLSFDAGS